MKLSELSLREYVAIEFLPAFMRHYSALGNTETEIAAATARYAFMYADAFLAAAGKMRDAKDHEIDALREGIKVCLDAERERRKDLKPGAPATTYTEARIKMLESLLA